VFLLVPTGAVPVAPLLPESRIDKLEQQLITFVALKNGNFLASKNLVASAEL
jgi:hypothetical protein